MFLCFALTLLFLYNPFVAASPSGTLSIQHNPSYRATIASSELQNFSPPDSSSVFAAAIILLFAWLLFPADLNLRRLKRTPESSTCACRLIFASLWYRPPPTL